VLVVTSPQSCFEIKTYTTDDFPTINHIDGSTINLDGVLLATHLKSVVFAASQSSIKPELGAVYVYQKKPHTLTFVATDSFRLAESTLQHAGVSVSHSILIPSRNALEIARTIETLGESPTITIAESQIALLFPCGVYITSRLIAGNFPDYEQIIPKEYQTYTTVLSSDFERGLRATTVFANKFQQVSFEVDPTHSHITLRSENAESGRAEEVVNAPGHGADLKLSFNQQYLTEALPHFHSDSIELAFAGVGRPLVMKSPDSSSFRYLVMPMNK
jgi:DNA polymerase-3 subunit beta